MAEVCVGFVQVNLLSSSSSAWCSFFVLFRLISDTLSRCVHCCHMMSCNNYHFGMKYLNMYELKKMNARESNSKDVQWTTMIIASTWGSTFKDSTTLYCERNHGIHTSIYKVDPIFIKARHASCCVFLG